VLFDPTEFQPLDPTQEPIFPAELMVNDVTYVKFLPIINYIF